MLDVLSREELDDVCLRDSMSIASNDSFVSAAEVTTIGTINATYFNIYILLASQELFMLE